MVAHYLQDYSLSTAAASFLLSFAFLVLVLILHRGGLRWQTLRDVPGPQSKSWLFGHQLEFNRQTDVGQLDFALNRQFGGAWKIDGCFGRNVLMICDPKAVHHVLHTMGYAYPKTREIKAFTALAFGRGVSWAGGETHVRHRKLMNPTFTASNLRTFYPVFRRVSGQLAQNWRDMLQERGDTSNVIDISRGLANTTLDIIGEAVFDYHFGSLDTLQAHNEFSEMFHNLWADSNLFPPPFAIVFAASWNYVPEIILRYVRHLPARQFIRFKEFLALGKKLAKDLIKNHAADPTMKRGRDILSLLVDANNDSITEDKLSEDEILSQVTTLLFAGHETTATTMTWTIYELAHHPEDQDRLREEIASKRAKTNAIGQSEFSTTDLENMPFLNSVIKEALRFHPISPWVTRQSAGHDIIPLAEPIVSPVTGKMVYEIEVLPGQPVTVSTCAYNRVKTAWGEDAHRWNPSRHLESGLKERQIPVGLYSNLLTFSGGPSGCIGWKFALTEMQTTIAELIESFEFSPPKEDITMLRVPIGAIMAPMVKGRFHERTQMPLTVTPLR